MSRPKYLYEIEAGKFVMHARSNLSATIQQADPLGRESEPDKAIFIDREDAAKLRDAIDTWLNEDE